MTRNPAEIVVKYHELAVTGAPEAGDLVADDVAFRGPAAHVQGRAGLNELNAQFAHSMERFERVHVSATGDTVAQRVRYHARTPAGGKLTLDLAEFYKLQNGHIKEIEVIYDPRAFLAAFGMEE